VPTARPRRVPSPDPSRAGYIRASINVLLIQAQSEAHAGRCWQIELSDDMRSSALALQGAWIGSAGGGRAWAVHQEEGVQLFAGCRGSSLLGRGESGGLKGY